MQHTINLNFRDLNNLMFISEKLKISLEESYKLALFVTASITADFSKKQIDKVLSSIHSDKPIN